MLCTEIEVQDSGVSIPILGYIKKDLNQTQCEQPCRKLCTGHFQLFKIEVCEWGWRKHVYEASREKKAEPSGACFDQKEAER